MSIIKQKVLIYSLSDQTVNYIVLHFKLHKCINPLYQSSMFDYAQQKKMQLDE